MIYFVKTLCLLSHLQQTLDQWNKVFFISGAISMTAGLIFCIFGSADVQPWNFETTQDYENYKANCEAKLANAKDLRNNVNSVCHL